MGEKTARAEYPKDYSVMYGLKVLLRFCECNCLLGKGIPPVLKGNGYRNRVTLSCKIVKKNSPLFTSNFYVLILMEVSRKKIVMNTCMICNGLK